ncbi:MAG: hypothetical protein KC731_06790, partial [Myxococcales bacterium]|nr:hypothetical protein [Myxococcales bacterium]
MRPLALAAAVVLGLSPMMAACGAEPPVRLAGPIAAVIPRVAPVRPPTAAEPPPRRTPPPQAALRDELLQRFEGWLGDMPSYTARALREGRPYPEGDLFPFVLPAHAYAMLAEQGVVPKAEARGRIEALLVPALRAVKQRVGDPMRLTSYGGQGTYLGQLSLVLRAYHRLAGREHRPLADHLRALLADALEAAQGAPLMSFPGQVWPFDTLPALLAVERPDLTAAHLAWLREHATDPTTGLPASRLDARGRPDAEPRGCALSWRIALLGELAPEEAARLYPLYVEHHWLERGIAAGFAEWPGGREGKADADSGPVVMGIGSAASSLGLAATLSQGDRDRLGALLRSAERARRALPSLADTFHLPHDERYVSGFLFGDAVL